VKMALFSVRRWLYVVTSEYTPARERGQVNLVALSSEQVGFVES
jgi:hypothetical protein